MKRSEVCLLGVLHFFLLHGRLLHAQNLDDDFQPELHRNWKLLPPKDKCGLPSLKPGETKIFGGFEPSLGSFPFIARLFHGHQGSLLFVCGGSLISNLYVLTAAHCIHDNENVLNIVQVHLGEHYTLTNPDCQGNVCAPPVQVIPVAKVVYHENYSPPPYQFDVGLIRLKYSPTFNGFVFPICLVCGKGMKMDFENEYGIAAGWGRTEYSADKTSDVLLAVSLKVWNHEQCKAMYKGNATDGHALRRFRNVTYPVERIIFDSEICASNEQGKSVCNGDSGGPFLWTGSFDPTVNDRTYLIGLSSLVYGGCGSGHASVFTRISSFMRWILDHMEE